MKLEKSPNIVSLPEFPPLPERLELPVLLKVGDDISTDEIMPAGARVLPLRSNIPRIADFVFDVIDESYPSRARAIRNGGHAIIGGENYGQGSSREHAAIAPRHLGLQLVVAKSFARIHRQNLVNYGVLPLTFADPEDYARVGSDEVLIVEELHRQLQAGAALDVSLGDKGTITLRHDLSQRETEIVRAGSLINWTRLSHGRS